MTDDEFERAKAEEKERIRAARTLRKLKQALADQQAALSSNAAVNDMRQRIRTLWNEHREALSAVQHDTAHLVARVETALESFYETLQAERAGATGAPPKTPSEPRSDSTPENTSAPDDPDAAWQAMQAEALLDELRAQIKADEAAPSSPTSADAAPKASGSDDGLPEKTIGRPRSSHD